MIAPLPTMAQVNIGISFGLPSPIGFAAPPEVIVLPETDNVYAVPGIDVDLFSGMAGGGVLGMVVGIARGIMTGAGLIITMFRGFIMM